MRKYIIISLMLMSIPAFAIVEVNIDKDGDVESIGSMFGKNAKANHAKNRYTEAEWSAFGITNQPPYIIKDGTAWRNMTPSEIATKDAEIQEEVTSEVTEDATADAILRTIAEAIKTNTKTYEGVKAIFTGEVDPKKAKKKKEKK